MEEGVYFITQFFLYNYIDNNNYNIDNNDNNESNYHHDKNWNDDYEYSSNDRIQETKNEAIEEGYYESV